MPVVAPTPPAKPTPPVVPAVTLSNSEQAGNAQPASTPAPANKTQAPGKTTVNPAVTGTVKELEGLGKAFQGNSPLKAGTKAEPVAKDTEAKSTTVPAMPLAAETGVASQAAVPAQPPLPGVKAAGFSYFPFVAIIAVTAVVLFGLRFFKPKKEQTRTVVDYSQRSTAVMDKDGVDIVVSPQTTAPKVKQNFEFRV